MPSPTPARKRRFRAALAILALTAAALVVAVAWSRSDSATKLLARELTTRASAALGRPVAVDLRTWQLFPPRISLDLTTTDHELELHAAGVDIATSWPALLRSPPHIDALAIDHLDVRITATSAEPSTLQFTDLLSAITIDTLVVGDLAVASGPDAFTLDGTSIRLERSASTHSYHGKLDVPALEIAELPPVRATAELTLSSHGLVLEDLLARFDDSTLRGRIEVDDPAANVYRGQLALELSAVDVARAAANLPDLGGVTASAALSSHAGAMTLEGLEVAVAGVAITGRIRHDPASIDAPIEASLVARIDDLTLVDERLGGLLSGLAGDATIVADVRAREARLDAITGTVVLSEARVSHPQLPPGIARVQMRSSLEPQRVVVELLRLDHPDLTVDGHGQIAHDQSWTFDGELEATDLFVDALDPTVASLRDRSARRSTATRPLRAATQLRGHGGQFESIVGTVHARLAPTPIIRLGGRSITLDAALQIAEGEVSCERLDIAGDDLSVSARGKLTPAAASQLHVVAALPAALLAELAQGTSSTAGEPTTGRVTVDAVVDGSWATLSGRATVATRDAIVAGLPTQLDVALDGDHGRWQLDGTVASGQGRARLVGDLAADAINVGMVLRRQEVATIARQLGFSGLDGGSVSGHLALQWPDPRLAGHLFGHELRLEGLVARSVELEAEVDSASLHITSFEMAVANGTVRAHGTVGPTTSRLAVDVHGIEVARFITAPEGWLQGTTLALNGQVVGAGRQLELVADLALEDLCVADQPQSSLVGNLLADDRGLQLMLAPGSRAPSASASAQDDHSASATVRVDADHTAVSVASWPLEVDLSRALSRETSGSHVRGRLDVALTAPIDRLAYPTGRVEVADLQLAVAGRDFVARDALRLDLDGGDLRIEPTTFDGASGSELTVHGALARRDAPHLRLALDGRADLRILRGVVPTLRSDGRADVALVLEGDPQQPRFSGRLELVDARLAYPGMPVALDGVHAILTAAAGEWRLEEFTADAGGGHLGASGEMTISGLDVVTYDLALDARAVRLEAAPGFRAEVNGTLSLTPDRLGAPQVTGRIDLLRGIYSEDVSLRGTAASRLPAGETSTVLERVGLDLELIADDTLQVRNNVAQMTVGARLRVRGSARNPSPEGRVVVVEGGTITFRDRTYAIDSGTVDYLGGWPVANRVAMRALTTVAKHDILLRASGTLDDLRIELSSQPSLPQEDIVSMLLFGRTRRELSGDNPITATDVAAYTSRPLRQRIETALGRALSLDELRIEPLAVSGRARPTARVTVAKQLTSRIRTTFSSDLSRERGDVYQLQYALGGGLSALAVRDGDESNAGVLRYERRPGRRAAQTSRQRIVEVEVRGAIALSSDAVQSTLRLKRGDDLRRANLLSRVDALRQRYVTTRRPQAQVRHTVVPVDGGVRVVIEVDEGPEVRLTATGLELPKALRRELFELWSLSVFRDELDRDLASHVESWLNNRGHIDAHVDATIQTAADGLLEARLTITPGPRVAVTSVTIDGANSDVIAELRDRLSFDDRRVFGSHHFDRTRLQAELDGIASLYEERGYLRADVRWRLERDPRRPDRAALRLTIDEGPRHTLRSVTITGCEAFDRTALMTVSGLRIDAPYPGNSEIEAAAARIRAHYDRAGYPDGAVHVTSTVATQPPAVDVAITVTEGEPLRIVAVDIAGAERSRRASILRKVGARPGELASDQRLARGRMALYQTGAFRTVDVRRRSRDGDGGTDVEVMLEELSPWTLDVGVGAHSENGLELSADVRHDNLLGRFARGGLGARWTPDDWQANASLTQPQLFGSGLEGLISGFVERSRRPLFDRDALGLSGQLGRSLSRTMRLQVGYEIERTDVTRTDSVGGREQTRTGSARLGLWRDTRDNPFWPSRGSLTRFETSLQAPVLLSERSFARLSAQHSRQLELGSAQLRLGARLGLAEPFGDDDVLPIDARFFAGGETSLRGFATDTVAPVRAPAAELAGGESPGGAALLLLNAQLTHQLWGLVHATAFVDAGNVYWSVDDLGHGGLRATAGLGVWIKTPIGPLRIENGWKLDRRADESSNRWHLSLGLPF